MTDGFVKSTARHLFQELAVMQTNSLEGKLPRWFCVTNHPAGLAHRQFSNYKPWKARTYLEIYHLRLDV